MRVIEDGYKYLLESAEGTNDQELQFIEKVKWEQMPHSPGEVPQEGYITKTDGVFNEELIKVLIHRMNVQNSKQFSQETRQAIEHLEQAYQVLKVRELRKQTDYVVKLKPTRRPLFQGNTMQVPGIYDYQPTNTIGADGLVRYTAGADAYDGEAANDMARG
jgi:hypothetical protein